MDKLEGKTAIVTGASYGVGPYIARALAAEGVNVVLAARSAEPLARVAAEIAATGGRAIAVPSDITDRTQREALVDRASAELGPVDILVNNAGALYGGRLHTRTVDQIRAVIETNLLAPMLLTRRLMGEMLARGRGHVVQVTSLAGKVGMPYLTSYTASKHGLVGFTHALQAELRGTGVHVSAVCPGFVARDGIWTRLHRRRVHPAFGLSEPERIARAVLRVLRRPTVEVLVNPIPVRPAVAAWALAPGLAARMFRVLGVDAFMRDIGMQLEREDAPAPATGD